MAEAQLRRLKVDYAPKVGHFKIVPFSLFVHELGVRITKILLLDRRRKPGHHLIPFDLHLVPLVL
jgi:hypothetical protein